MSVCVLMCMSLSLCRNELANSTVYRFTRTVRVFLASFDGMNRNDDRGFKRMPRSDRSRIRCNRNVWSGHARVRWTFSSNGTRSKGTWTSATGRIRTWGASAGCSSDWRRCYNSDRETWRCELVEKRGTWTRRRPVRPLDVPSKTDRLQTKESIAKRYVSGMDSRSRRLSSGNFPLWSGRKEEKKKK